MNFKISMLLIMLVVFAVVCYCNAEDCVPDTHWKEDCNTCFCTPTGLRACTKVGCVTPPPNWQG
ncbi:unnamed protein product [Chironomus riparius]|uniref:Pacifastin domain-containing protein n=1 Tax=Chironomus riparius TaxID=315576 RepID=A0A9P0IMG2_9DIPT|nr:unnamed protein product [Chironomus riparius]